MRTCSKCNTVKKESDFYKFKTGSLYGQCKTCIKAKAWSRHVDNRSNELDRMRKGHIFRTYGLSSDDYNSLLKQQGGVCAICKKTQKPFTNGKGIIKNLAVDHDHKTSKVRGLLCKDCNQAIGLLNDDSYLVSSALAYLGAN